MKALKSLLALAFVALMAIVFSTLTGLPAIACFTVLVIASLVRRPAGSLFMAVTVEIWTKDIIDNLFKDNQFAQFAFNADQWVVAGKIVHIPQAGAPDPSQKNVTVFPITAVKRTDSDVLYAIDTYYQPPKFVEKIEQYELAYDKRQSIMGEQQSQLIEDSMNGLLYRWGWKAPSDIGTTPITSFLTTGAATAVDVISGATGSRLAFTKDIFSKVKKAMDAANISPNGRIAMLTAYHYQQFIDSLSDAAQTNFYRQADMSKGIIGDYLGFKVIMRSSVQRWRQVAAVWTPVDEQATGFAASDKTLDSAASLFWETNSVERARGDVNVFDDAGRPEYYGDVFSMNMRLGGRTRRASGIYAAIEDIA